MSKRLRFDVTLIVDDAVSEERAQEIVGEMLADITQAPGYEDVVLVDEVAMKDRAAVDLLDMLKELNKEDVEDAMDVVEEMSDE